MTNLDPRRREVLRSAGGLSALAVLASIGLLPARAALADWNKAAFDTKTVADTLKALGLGTPTESGDLQIIASDIAENGAVVPVQIVSKLPKTTKIALLVEKNPNLLAATFDIVDGMVADVSTRIKMGQTSDVIAVAVADGKVVSSTKEIKVTLGGCGG